MQAKFTEGSILRHICTMTAASTVGLLSLFFVDLMDMYWLSLLGEIELAAAIGYAGSILFFTLSLCIGLSIGCSAVVSHAIGRSDRARAQALVGNVLLVILVITTPVMALVFFSLELCLSWLGADGRAFELAYSYIRIVLPSMPLMALAMAASGVLRALGNAKEAMYLTLIGGIVNAVLDPIFIFGLDWGIEGAAVATVLARFAMLGYGAVLLLRHDVISAPAWTALWSDFRVYCQVAVPAVLTNLATPIGVAYVTAVMARFGDSAVAGNAIVGKIQPLAFAGLFALSGSVGPIVGQNLGAGRIDRIMETLTKSVQFVLVYCAVACALLLLLTQPLIAAFRVEGDAALLIRSFCFGLSTMFVFQGFTFCSNAFFNNLKVAHWATGMNFAKATLFTIPFAYFGGELGGPVGVWAGVYVGTALIGLAGLWLARYRIRHLAVEAAAT